MVRKCARIFVPGHYLFLEAHRFPLSWLSKTVQTLLGTDHVRGQISEQIFASNEGYYVYIYVYLFISLVFCLVTNVLRLTIHWID